jgi:hypothetical protein
MRRGLKEEATRRKSWVQPCLNNSSDLDSFVAARKLD